MALLPADYLCAKSYETREICRTNNTLAIQHYSGSWLSDDDKAYLQCCRLYQQKFPWIYQDRRGRLMLKLIAAYKTGGASMVTKKIKER